MEKTNIDTVYKFEPEGLWFTSDTHFCHENIVKFSGRPFANAAEMNEELIRRWNETVPEDGIVFHLGDFCMGGSKEWNDIMYRLHGKIYLILGNHDMKNIKQGFMRRFVLFFFGKDAGVLSLSGRFRPASSCRRRPSEESRNTVPAPGSSVLWRCLRSRRREIRSRTVSATRPDRPKRPR